jgi:putative multiple sugar transport system ATP-binding protein
MNDFILEMKNITKHFPGVYALSNVNFSVKQNHIHALVGENGAGKSTLINILGGVYTTGTYDGEIVFKDEKCDFRDIHSSEKKGIAIIHQELALVPYLSIAENIFLGNEKAKYTVIDWDETIKDAAQLLERVHFKEDPRSLIKNLGVGIQQLVVIAKALSKKATLLVLDEPTAALNEESSRHLLSLLLELKKEGMTSILISHKLNEVSSVADEITILRDGRTIETLVNGIDDISEDRIIKGMVGRAISDRFPGSKRTPGEICFEVKNWNVFHQTDSDRHFIRNINFYARKGEVVGFSGLMGAGRTELAMSIFGRSWGQKITGEILKDGKTIEIKNISDAINNGIAYLTEDRKNAGLILIDNIKHNVALPNLGKISRRTVINDELESRQVDKYCSRLNVKSTGILQKTGNLSGGNQQKIVIAKWIMAEMDVLILDEPTRGIDVGAKYEIYTIINQLAQEGKCVILITSELPEILGICDRIYVMNDGRIVGELEKNNASQESIMKFIMQSNSEV